MPRLFYTLLFYLLMPLILLRLLYRASKAPAYAQRVAERFGIFNAGFLNAGTLNAGAGSTAQGSIWVHAVSVGEVIAAAPMIKRLQNDYPDKTVVVTTMTPTGSDRVRALFTEGKDPGQVFHVYAPYDVPAAIRGFLDRVQPCALIIMETELWPNIIATCQRRSIPVVVANARLSAGSAKGYERLAALTQPMFSALSKVAAQHAADGERYVRLGLPAANLTVTGSIKFDLELGQELRAQAAQERLQCCGKDGTRLIFIAASTHEGEDEIILAAFKQVLIEHPDMLLVLVPRHPERFDRVASLCREQGLKVARRSQQPATLDATQVLVGDTMGELLLLFGCADIAFVGGSLVARGGHNMLEPAGWGLPVITGNSDFNFLEISRLLTEAGGLTKVSDSTGLAEVLLTLAADPQAREKMGNSAMSVVEANRGSLDRLMLELAPLVPGGD